MNFFRKMEHKFGKYAIRNLMYYIIMMYVAGLLISFVNPTFYYLYLALDMRAILHGQIWRLVTFLISPPSGGGLSFEGILFNAIAIFLYYSLGTTLERVWGTFRFNVYFFMGVVGHILAALLIYLIFGVSVPLTTYYLNESLLLAFAATFPEVQFWLMGILPIKAKWFGIFIGAQFVYSFLMGSMISKISIGLSLLNFAVFFLMTRNYKQVNPKEIRRKQNYKNEVRRAEVTKIQLTHHKCAVCGRTEKDDPTLEFRYCSKCAGNLEYCTDHLYTHQHVTEEEIR